MKNKNVREVALETLLAIEKNQAYSNLLLNKMIEKHQLSSKDVGLLTEIVYGTIQRRDTLDYFLSPFLKKSSKLEVWVKVLLRLSLYQMLYLDRVPDRAAIYEAVEIAKKRGHKGIASMVNGVLRAVQREGVPSLEKIADPVERLAVETSHPIWLVKRWVKQFGMDEARKMCETNLLPPEQTARVNIARITVEEAIERLRQEEVEVTNGDVAPEAIKAVKGNLAHTLAYKEGYLTIQDESSMLVAKALGAKENEYVLDSCAAPGGKSTHIAELMHNTGQVVSLDIHDHKVKLIQEQAERLHLTNIQTKVLDSRKVSEYFEKESFDKILVDAPCTGFGVLRRKPDIKYAKTENDIRQLAKIQREILAAVAPLLKKGGILVYSTCTIDQEENSDVIEDFLRHHPQFNLDETLKERLPEKVRPYVSEGKLQILPHYFGSDGFFIASLRKKV
ncbi:16S rRNA (cytosine967-C5)-methyltransferase [Anoxybacillus calidus]|jgi:16S rRNA (cytosine967-C5)-methyltransferase|uniref:16S rRNA (cytosine(967)-C(5))-methyltransferase n=1 Tax=[Anoxybacillus] calidus TaxID=575178 RepID=A0A7V9YYT7_9BACL|nr:16S rRNA (cytosine(967)-C(5))-methyltransferase RsmB [Anoxybacillus calidus]MBA2870755.1 16S rRNA (cytosine967-C5)-methyltransferase [Anoxybacillus calidus]